MAGGGGRAALAGGGDCGPCTGEEKVQGGDLGVGARAGAALWIQGRAGLWGLLMRWPRRATSRCMAPCGGTPHCRSRARQAGRTSFCRLAPAGGSTSMSVPLRKVGHGPIRLCEPSSGRIWREGQRHAAVTCTTALALANSARSSATGAPPALLQALDKARASRSACTCASGHSRELGAAA